MKKPLFSPFHIPEPDASQVCAFPCPEAGVLCPQAARLVLSLSK